MAIGITSLVFDLHVSILRENLKKTKTQNGGAAADRAPTLKSVMESPNTKREKLNSRNRANVLSAYSSVLKSVKKCS